MTKHIKPLYLSLLFCFGIISAYAGGPHVSFNYPYNGQHFKYGEEIKINVKATDYDGIQYVDLYVDGNHYHDYHIDREYHYPYEWGTKRNAKLKNLKPGKYKLIAVAKDGRGYKTTRSIYIYVDEYNPCYYAYDFKCIEPNHHYAAGSDVHVELDLPEGYSHIKYADLYVNGKSYGRESKYPYQWGKGYKHSGHQVLNNIQPGTYHLRCVIYDNCGYEQYKEVTFHVDAYDDCYDPFYNFEHYGNNYHIVQDHKWAGLKNYYSPIVGGHGLYRQKTLKFHKGYGAALDLGLLTYGKYEISHYLYVPPHSKAQIGFYDNHFNTVKGFTFSDYGYGYQYWKKVRYVIDMDRKQIQLYVDCEYIGTYAFHNYDVRYLVFHSNYDYHKFYVDDIYLKYQQHCLF